MIMLCQKYKGSTLVTGLFLLMLVFLLFFNSKDKLISQGKYIENNYAEYLKFRLELSKQLEHIDCPFENSDFSENIQKLKYNYHCIKDGLFLQDKISYQTYVKVESIESYFNVSKVKVVIDDLNQLPESSITNPQVVILNKPFSGKLVNDFYGIIITKYPIELSLGALIYGTIYSPLNKEEHKLRYVKKSEREMINKIVLHYTQYSYLANSKSFLYAEN